MKGIKWVMTAACAVIALGAAIAGHADAYFKGAGSSAMFNAFAKAAFTAKPNSFIFAGSTAGKTASIHDPVAGDNQSGNVWIVWTTATAGDPTAAVTSVAYYVSVDSTVGQREYYNQGVVTFPAAGTTTDTPPGGTGSGTTLSSNVTTYLAGSDSAGPRSRIDNGMTDITPADGKVATHRFLAAGYNGSGAFKGYNATGGASSVNVFDFNAFGAGARTTVLTAIGASPIVVVVNKTAAGTGDLGAATVKNVGRFTLGNILSGTMVSTSDIDQSITFSAGKPLCTFVREGLSGTYNTMEYCIPQSLEVGLTQENNVTSAAATNPLNEAGWSVTGGVGSFTGAGRVRVIGTGASAGGVKVTKNSLAYFFYSSGNITSAGGSGVVKYLTVDGVDPLYASYSNGDPSAAPTFDHIQDGSYPAWSILRMITPTAPSGDLQTLLNSLDSTTASGYVPSSALQIFRSHRTTADVPVASNGNNQDLGGDPEEGADAGGAVFSVNADRNYARFVGVELVGFRQ